MVLCTKLPNGDLLVTAGNETRHWLKERAHCDYWDTLGQLFEGYSCNGSFAPFDAADANPFVGLTSSPCVAESMTTNDDGENEIDGACWWFPSYAIRDPLDELKTKGRTVFTLARED